MEFLFFFYRFLFAGSIIKRPKCVPTCKQVHYYKDGTLQKYYQFTNTNKKTSALEKWRV